MSDSIGMSPAFNEQVKKTVRETLRRERSSASHNGRWHKKGGGGGSNAFLFQVVSSDPSIRRALVQIETRTFTGPAYGSTLDDTVVYIYDRMGCLLNEPNVNLTGRWGRAELYIWGNAAFPTWFAAGDEPSKIWLITNLCCPQTSCS